MTDSRTTATSRGDATFEPYVSADRNLPEVTVRVLVLGSLLAVVMGAANTYLGLYAGMTVSASIPAAVISMAILRGLLRTGSILENNQVQTMASTGESLAAGVIFTVPAMLLVGAWQEFEFWPTTLITMLGGVLGIVFMVPMRRALIVDRPDLVYPEGVACSEVLIVGEERGQGVRAIVQGVAIGGVFKILASGLSIVRGAVEVGFSFGRSAVSVGSDISAALLAVGYIVGLQIAGLVFLGGVIGWIAIPILGGFEGGSVLEHASAVRSSHVRYIGVGAMLVGGLWSIIQVRKGIVAGVTALRGVGGTNREDATGVPRTEQNLPMTALATVFVLAVLGTFAFYHSLVGSAPIAAVTALLMVFTAFLFVAVATYIAGLVGSSNSPVSGMTICALLIASGVLLALGISGDQAILATLGIAGVVCCATCTSGDVAQDLKTGLLIGATPRRQQTVELIAAVVASFFFAPILTVLHAGYGIGTGEPGSLPAPQAALFASLAEGFFGDGTLPWNMIILGGAIGLVLIVANQMLEASGSNVRTYVMPVAVGIYLPSTLSVPIFLGGLLKYFVDRNRRGRRVSEGRDGGLLFGSGLIAGEALMGIALAGVVAAEIALPTPFGAAHWLPSVIVFALIAAWFWRSATREEA